MNNLWVRTGVVAVMTCLALASCDDNPVDEGRGDAVSLIVNPTFGAVDAADTTRVAANAEDRYGELTLADIQFSKCDDKITIEPDPTRVALEPPDRVIVIGETLGESCVVASGPGGLTDTSVVVVVAAALEVTSAPEELRAGETSEVVVTTVGVDGQPVGPFARSDVTYESDSSEIVTVTDDIGSISTSEAGSAEITVTWEMAGITRTATHTITVLPNVPTGAALANESFGGLAVADSTKLEVIVTDDEGNQNTNASEITGISVQSSDLGVATVRADRDLSEDGESVTLTVAVFGVAPGTASITGTVSTTEGDLAFGPADVTILAPVINSINPTTGAFGSSVTISGSSFVASGFETLVVVDGEALGNITVTSNSEIDAVMPTFPDGAYDVQVSVGGVLSNAVSWTLSGDFDSDATEPDNNSEATAPVITMPADFAGSFEGGDIDDIFKFTVNRDVTINILLNWAGSKDLDFFVTLLDGSAADGSFDGEGCEGFFDQPEEQDCELPAGTYLLWVEDFTAADTDDFTLVDYTLKASVIQ